MTDLGSLDAHGRLIQPATLRIERLLPGPVERVWAWLTDGGLRSRSLAAGEMELSVGAPFELVWRNDTPGDMPGPRPEAFPAEQRMRSRVLALDPPRLLTIAWGTDGEVSFALAPRGDRVLLVLTHRRLADREGMLDVAGGWHAHLDILRARLAGESVAPFWEAWLRLRREYDARLPR